MRWRPVLEGRDAGADGPGLPDVVTPYPSAVAALSYHAAVVMGKDVDQPRNLAKSVTVE